MNRGFYFQHFYDKFEPILLNLVKPKMALALSGGWDTRMLAAILTNNNIHLPAITHQTSMIEALIASKIAYTLKLNLYWLPREGDSILAQHGFNYLLQGIGADALCGCWQGMYAKTDMQFHIAQLNSLHQQDIEYPPPYSTKPKHINPFLDSEVRTLLEEIPWQYRKGKQLQRWVLKTKFPQLWNIPYYNSLLPNQFPPEIHFIVNKLHKVSWRAMNKHMSLKVALTIYARKELPKVD